MERTEPLSGAGVPEAPDVETSSAGYARRFAGTVGAFFLERQLSAVRSFIQDLPPSARILDVGGGHGQLAPGLLADGFDVTVQGTAPKCFDRLLELQAQFPSTFHYAVSSLEHLEFADCSFDVVIAVRLMAHVPDWKALLKELSRVSKRIVIIDYASLLSFNILTPLLFQLKKQIEKNTRTYLCHWPWQVRKELAACGCVIKGEDKQFFFPMGLHRLFESRAFTESSEAAANAIGLTKAFGSPSILAAEKINRGS